MALAAWDDGGYPGTGGSSTLVTGSIPDGHEVIVFYHGRNLNTPPFTHGGGLTSVTNLEYAQTGFGDDGEFYVYKAVKNGTGALTLTPSQTANSWWRAIVVDCDTNTVVDSNAQSEGLFDTTISYASPSMPAGGGTGVGLVLVCRGNSITLTAPTFTGLDVSDAHDQGNFRVGIRYGSLAIAASNTSTLTGSLGGSDSHYDSWVLLQPSAATVEATGLGAWGGLTGTAVATVQHEASALGQWGALTGTMAATVETPPAGIELVASTAAGSTNNTSVTTSEINTTGATLLVAVLADGSATDSVSDSKDNDWVMAEESGVATTYPNARIWYAANPTVGTGHTFTGTGAGIAMQVMAFSGVDTTDPLDQVAAHDTGGNPYNDIKLGYFGGDSITPTEDNELVVFGVGHGSGSGTPTVDSGFTMSGFALLAAGQHWGGAAAYKIQTAAGTEDPLFDGIDAYTSITAATFKAGAAATVVEATGLGQWGALTGTMAATVETPPVVPELIDTGFESGNSNGFTTNAFDTTGADFIVISAGFAGTGDYTISDNKGNAWHKVTAAVSGDRQHRFYYAYNCAGKVGTGHTFTIDGSGNFPHLSIAWYSGLKTDGDPLDQVDTTVPGFTPSITLGPITPTVDNELVIAGAAHGAPDHAITVDTLTMIIDDPVGAAGAWESSVAHEIQTTATQRTAVFTEDAGGSSTGWTGTIVSFKPFSGAPPAGPAEGPIKHMEAGDFLDNDVYVRVGGVWQRVDVMYRRESGVWVRYM